MRKNTRAYFESAKRLGFPVTEIEEIEGFRLTLANKNYYFAPLVTSFNNESGVILSTNKYYANQLMRLSGIPVPKSAFVEVDGFNLDRLIQQTSHMKFPVVMKPPAWTSKGEDVICNIPNLHELHKLCEEKIKVYGALLIEEFHGNLNSFRVLVFKNKILDVLARFPAKVVGNGTDSLRVLVENTNVARLKESTFYAPICFDREALYRLREQKISEESIIQKDKVVYLGYASNASRGGSIQSIANNMCKENKDICLKVARVLNLELAGIDVQCRSLAEPMTQANGIIIEANCSPSMVIHEYGVGGTKKMVSMIIMKSFIYKHPLSYFLHLCNINAYRKMILTVFFIVIVTVFSAIFYYKQFY